MQGTVRYPGIVRLVPLLLVVAPAAKTSVATVATVKLPLASINRAARKFVLPDRLQAL
jgi:hypothetical protein